MSTPTNDLLVNDLYVTVERIIPASPSQVFEAWLDARALAEFIRPAPGVTVPRAEVDAREGGRFVIVMKVGDQELPHRGEYRIIEKYTRLAFSWHSNYTTDESLVTLDFVPHGENHTKLTLHHVGFPNQKARNNHDTGWHNITQHLADIYFHEP